MPSDPGSGPILIRRDASPANCGGHSGDRGSIKKPEGRGNSLGRFESKRSLRGIRLSRVFLFLSS
ncbi:MAG: hypothetical protein CMP31_05265 [Roseibacillus sp.]|nr:hypothetical protein [Roseibacillus sp.]